MHGYHGKLLFVNLTDLTYEIRPLEEQLVKDFLSGSALAARIYMDEMPANTPWDAPESLLGFVSGITNGTNAFFGGRFILTCKSPVTGCWNDSYSGGKFGPYLKKAGFDAVFVRGIAEKPVYIYLNDGEVEFRDATNLWGKTLPETHEMLEQELGTKDFSESAIGPGGEALSFMSGVFNDVVRPTARGGNGAVMGKKNLKAIVARGTQTVSVADAATIKKFNMDIANLMRTDKKNVVQNGMGTRGTAASITANLLCGDGPTKNWSSYAGDDYPEEMSNKISAIEIDRYKVKKFVCNSCPLGCGAIYSIDSEKYPNLKQTERPEYETQASFGSQLLIDDPLVVLEANDMCNRYGIDTISAGQTLAWAMEAFEKGYLTEEDLDGDALHWGDGDMMLKFLEKICRNEGNVGKLLRHGSQYAADSIEKGHDLLFCASGLELAQHDPRNSAPYARTYKYDPSPGRHQRGGRGSVLKAADPSIRHNTKHIGFIECESISEWEIINSAGYCSFQKVIFPIDWIRDVVNAITGYDYTWSEWYNLGIRMFMARLGFNLREGKRRKDYTFSERCECRPPLSAGPNKDVVIDVEGLADSVFDVLGCDLDYVPYKNMLRRLGGLDYLIDILYPSTPS